MSDEQTMPDVIYARSAGNGCGWWYPQDDADTPYLRCPDNVDPSTVAKGLADMATTIATLTAELDELKAKLPKTADGVVVVPGMSLYAPKWWCTEEGDPEPLSRHCESSIDTFAYPLNEWFSTREAAEKGGEG